jgi:dTDP-4-dehydrorhamnose reductase
MPPRDQTLWYETGTIVLLGFRGMLGTEWNEHLRRLIDPKRLLLLDVESCDLTDLLSIDHAIPDTASVVINCAAYSDVDGAESNEELATQINGIAVGRLAQRCSDIGALLVHFSTDYVFDGLATTPYMPSAPRNPCNAYGRSKVLGETLVQESGCEALMLRTSGLYAPHGKNFVRTITRYCQERDELHVVDDQHGCPTWTAGLVHTSDALMQAQVRGIYHATDGGSCTWYELATAIASQINPDCRVKPCSTDEYPRAAARPGYSVLNSSQTEKIVGALPPWRESLRHVLATMLEARNVADHTG